MNKEDKLFVSLAGNIEDRKLEQKIKQKTVFTGRRVVQMARRSQMKRIFEKRWWRQGCCVCNSTCCEDYGLNKDFFHGFLDEDKPIHFIYKGTKYKNNCAHQYSKCPQI